MGTWGESVPGPVATMLPPHHPLWQRALLTMEEMYQADAAAMAGGVAGPILMEAAGRAVTEAILQRFPLQPVTVLCGPGNNGGDGFVIARWLAQQGWPVRVALLGEPGRLSGDAALNCERWSGPILPLDPASVPESGLVVDALFGAGLQRPLEGMAALVVEAVLQRGLPVIAVDIPSGVEGNSGAVLGLAPAAVLTVTFFRAKPGHCLFPGRALCGELLVADIGIPETVLADIQPRCFQNDPLLWLPLFRWPRWEDHKYTRGHGVVIGGGQMTGAGRLAARAARRAGIGLLTLVAPEHALPVYQIDQPGLLVEALPAADQWLVELLGERRRNAVLIGPGSGVDGMTRQRVRVVLGSGLACVLDADALTVWESEPEALFTALRACQGPVVLTPHAGEFQRLFPGHEAALSKPESRVELVRRAASRCGQVVLLKGADTILAAPDGRAIINTNAPPTLASGGTGDVLAGILLGLLAQGMPAFEAAAAAVWLQGAAATLVGPGLIAEDIPEHLPQVLAHLAGWEVAPIGPAAEKLAGPASPPVLATTGTRRYLHS